MEHKGSVLEILKERLGSWLTYRQLWEIEWTKNYNRYYNVFQKELSDTEGDGWHSKECYPVVRKKVKVVNSIIEKTMYSGGRFPFDITKTPHSDELEDKFIDQFGIDRDALCRDMKKEVNDAYIESKAIIQIRRATRMLPVYGTCVVYGPIGKKISANKWVMKNEGVAEEALPPLQDLPEETLAQMTEEQMAQYEQEALMSLKNSHDSVMMDTEFELEESEKIVPHIRYCDLWDIVLDPEGRNAKEGRGVFEIRRVSKSTIAEMVNEVDDESNPVYDRRIIETILGSNDKLWQEYERGPHRKKSDAELDEEWVDMVFFSGQVTKRDLGINDTDEPVEIEASFVGEHLLMQKEVKSRRNARKYHSCVWSECEGSPYGYGVAYELEDSAKVMNSMLRLANDNIRLHASPPVTIDKRFVKNPEIKMAPGAEILTRDGAKANEVMDFAVYPNVTQAIHNHMQFCDDWANSAAGVPDILEGDTLGNKANTKYEAMVLKESAMNQLGMAIQSIDDDIIVPITEAYYDWVMNYSDDKTIKGDFQIIATGFRSFENNFKARESLISYLQMANDPSIKPFIKVDEIIRRIAEIDGLDDKYVATKEEAEESIHAQYQGQMEQLQAVIGQLQQQLNDKTAKLEMDQRKIELDAAHKAAEMESKEEMHEEKIKADLIKEGMKHE